MEKKLRTRYWSHSKLARALNKWVGISNPSALSWEGWEEHKKASKEKSPVVYYITGTLFNKIQNIVCWPKDKYWSIVYWYNNRFIDKVQYLQTGLNPNTYHEVDTRVLHALFNTLVIFIEEEKAWMEYISHPKMYDIPWYKLSRWTRKFGKFNYPELGLKYLEWEKTLRYNEDWTSKDDPKFGELTDQAESAWEQYRLYHWWKEVYPNRTDVYGEDFEAIKATGPKYYEVIHRIEAEFMKEDEQMMIRLIKILPNLWT